MDIVCVGDCGNKRVGDLGPRVALPFSEVCVVCHGPVLRDDVHAELDGDFAEGAAAVPLRERGVDGFEVEHRDGVAVGVERAGEAWLDDHFFAEDGGALAALDAVETEVVGDLVDGFDLESLEVAALSRAEAVELLDGVFGGCGGAAAQEGALVWGGAVVAGFDVGERTFEHAELRADLGGDLWAELVDLGGDVGSGEEWALVRVAVAGVMTSSKSSRRCAG